MSNLTRVEKRELKDALADVSNYVTMIAFSNPKLRPMLELYLRRKLQKVRVLRSKNVKHIRAQSSREALQKDIAVLRGLLWRSDCNGLWQEYEDNEHNLCDVAGCYNVVVKMGYRNRCAGHQPRKSRWEPPK